MNTLLLKKFTPEILQGVKAVGLKPDPQKGVLSKEDAEALEHKTGRSVGELALLGIEANASPEQQKSRRELVHETIELMAAFESRPVTPAHSA